MKLNVLAAAALLFLAGCASPLGQVRDTPLERPARNFIVLWSGIPGLLGITGAAVIIADGLAVTNRHVVEASDRIAGYAGGRSFHNIEVVAVSDRIDLAVLRIPSGLGEPVSLGTAHPGRRLWLMGVPSIFAAPVVDGVLMRSDGVACTGPPCDSSLMHTGLMIRAHIAQGFSGGPVVDDDGNLVGLVQGIFTQLIDDGGRPLPLDGTIVAFAYDAHDVMNEVMRLTSQQTAGEPLLWRTQEGDGSRAPNENGRPRRAPVSLN